MDIKSLKRILKIKMEGKPEKPVLVFSKQKEYLSEIPMIQAERLVSEGKALPISTHSITLLPQPIKKQKELNIDKIYEKLIDLAFKKSKRVV